MKTIILIDGNNLAIRNAFANAGLYASLAKDTETFNPDNLFDDNIVFPTGVLHGFFQSLVMLKNQYPDCYILVLWDKGYDQRLKLSREAVQRGIIKQAYKENRIKKEMPKEIEEMKTQRPVLIDMLQATSIPQFSLPGEEADDLIASYAEKYGKEYRVIINSTDEDFYQVLAEHVAIFKKEDEYTMENFVGQYGLRPPQWVDVGAMQGDSGDNIISLPGWGEVTAVKAIQQYGSYQAVLNQYHKELDPLRVQYPDIPVGDTERFARLQSAATESGKPVFPDIWEGMPFSGLALAVHEKVCKTKIPKAKLVAMMYEARTHVAYQLKQMNRKLEIPDLPTKDTARPDAFLEICVKYQLNEVGARADLLCAGQTVEESVF